MSINESRVTPTIETSAGSLHDIVARLRSTGSEWTSVEVKAAAGGVPKSLWPTISAFSNRGGGVILLGLDEQNGFTPAPGFDPIRIRDGVADAFRSRGAREDAGPLTPRPTGTVEVGDVGGAAVVVVDVEEAPAGDRPVYVTTAGPIGGSYERIGDGDHRLGGYGVFLLHSDRAQPTEDTEPVDGATIDDLDAEILERFLARLRRLRPRVAAGVSDATALARMRVLAVDEVRPTLAGLLTLGAYPQQFFPQLVVTFASYPGQSKSHVVEGVRMLDRRTFDGPIPAMIDESVAAVIRNLRIRRVSRGAGATDEPEIPVDAIREAIANALAHRDYSAQARGNQVLLELYPDRLVVDNPGTIWGGRSIADLWNGRSRSRNAVLASLLTEVPFADRDETVSENAGSGIPRMAGVLGRSGLAAPLFAETATSLSVTLDRDGLMDPATSQWLESIGAGDLPVDEQRILALVHRGYPVEDTLLRVQFGMDMREASDTLRGLVSAGWLRHPRRAAAPYLPAPRLSGAEQPALLELPAAETNGRSMDERIIESLVDHGTLGVQELADHIHSSANAIRPRLRVLLQQGAIVATAGPTSRKRKYRLATD